MASGEEFLAREPVGRLLFRLAVPTVAAQLVNMLYNVVDRIFIGHMPSVGSMALTGVGVCLPIIMIISAFAALVSSGGAPRASIFMGRGEEHKAEKILGGCFLLQVIISAALTAVLLIWNRPLLLLFGASENTIEYAAQYMSVYAVGTLFVQLTLGMNAFITAQGFTRIGMLTVLIGAAVNTALDPLFIYGFKMGVRGAALATIISQLISCVWSVAFLCSKHSFLRLRFKYMRFDPHLILPCIVLGLATFIMQSSDSIINVCFNASLLKYGGDVAVGAMTICSGIMQMTLLPIQGISQASQPIASYNYGAGNVARLKQVFKLTLISCVTISTVLWALVMAAPRAFSTIFTTDASLIDFSVGSIRTYCAALFLFGIQMACQITFVSLSYAGSSITVAVVRKFVLLLPLIYTLPLMMADKARAVFLAEPIADVIAITFTAILFAIRFKKATREMEQKLL